MPARPIRYLAAIALWALPIQAGAQSQPALEALRVTRTADDGAEGSLRWAFERNNTAPGRFRIEIAPAGQAPHVIKLASPLPAIKGPVAIEGAAWKRSGEFIVLDGSGYIEDKGPQTCPGAVPGQYGTNVRTTTNPGLALVDTQGVEISGLEVSNFCIGVLIHRSSSNSIHDNRIVANRGGAGVMLTGDDGNGNPTATTTVHNKVLRNEFLDNGDGLELTRGAAFNLVADNVFRSTDANPEPSQGIEILLGNDNTVVSNRFEGYSDGLQINWGHRNYIAANIFTNNTFGLSLSGAGNIIDGNVHLRQRRGHRGAAGARHDDGMDFPQRHLRQRSKDRALLRRRQLRPRYPEGRHRVWPAEWRARTLCRQARHRRRSAARKPRHDLP
jgi:3-dehydroshikimate dehydratase